MKIAVIGGGAAGFFSSISAKTHFPDAEIHLIEKSSKTLSKVRISGGGRCNVTHFCLNTRVLARHYPRGEKFLKKSFEQFSVKDTIDWFEGRGVTLHVESDNRMFPSSNKSETIIGALTEEVKRLRINLRKNTPVDIIKKVESGFDIYVQNRLEHFDRIIVATGGSPKLQGFKWLTELGVGVVSPVPSLFTFNIPQSNITSLMGVSAPMAEVQIVGHKLSSQGPVLITHWGVSGPSVLKLSAMGARILADLNYQFKVSVAWVGMKEHQLREIFEDQVFIKNRKQIGNLQLFDLPKRLWTYLISKADINGALPWHEISKKLQNRLINLLVNDIYTVKGKTTFKEEFVTAGGVDLRNIDPKSMESKQVSGLFFAGEVLDVDGITGGFNFQAAWTTGFIAGKHVGR